MLPVLVNDGVGSHVAFVASLMLFVVMVIIYDPGGRHMKVMVLQLEPGGGVLPQKFGRGVRPASQNPYPVYDQNLQFSLPYL